MERLNFCPGSPEKGTRKKHRTSCQMRKADRSAKTSSRGDRGNRNPNPNRTRVIHARPALRSLAKKLSRAAFNDKISRPGLDRFGSVDSYFAVSTVANSTRIDSDWDCICRRFSRNPETPILHQLIFCLF